MCLSNVGKCKILDEDLVVYKNLKKIDFNDSSFYTTYYNVEIKIGKIYQSTLELEDNNQVECGLHSFIFLEDALENLKEYQFVAECIIPKGSRCYIGLFKNLSGSFKSIASDQLHYIKIIKQKVRNTQLGKRFGHFKIINC